MGALAVAAGAAIGALLPASSVEDEMFGETSAEATEELKGKAQQKMEEGQEQAVAAPSSEGSSQERAARESRQTRSEERRVGKERRGRRWGERAKRESR